jgi:hypothetical protein
MDADRLRILRRKQFLYSNVIYIVLIGLFMALVLSPLSARTVCTILGVVLLISALRLQLVRRTHLLLGLLPAMKELLAYERQKLGDRWRDYYASGFFLQLVVSLFFFVQAVMRPGKIPLYEGLPRWWFIVIPVLFLLLANLNLRIHTKRIDEKTEEQLHIYAEDKRLFTLVFAGVATAFILLGSLVVWVMT